MDSLKKIRNWIQGNWVDSSNGAEGQIYNPAKTSQMLATFPLSTREDTQRAIEAAREALPGWGNTPGPSRGAILDKAAQIIAARAQEIARVITQEEGKTLAESQAEVMRARDIFRYYAGEGWRIAGKTLPSNSTDEMLYTRREPLGVIGLITPWNFPISIPAWKIAPALVYGNTVVFKPATLTPQSGLLLVETLIEAGIPSGVINFVTGSGSVVGEEIVTNRLISGLSFTGSYEVGIALYPKTVKNLTRVQLEMGGKNPLLVMDDANLQLAVEIAVKGGFGLTGQACTATSRVLVSEGIASEFAHALADAARQIPFGNGLEAGIRMGPAISQDQLETDLNFIEIGQREGAKLLAGGASAREGGYFVQPTVFDHVSPNMRIAQEEIFGPIISLLRVKDLDEGLEQANNISYGLSAGIVTNNLHDAIKFANRIEAGVVKINRPTTGGMVQVPFGGFKNSSSNTFKEQGQEAIEFFTRLKTIYLAYDG